MSGGTTLKDKIAKQLQKIAESRRAEKLERLSSVSPTQAWERDKDKLIREEEAALERDLFVKRRYQRATRSASEVVNPRSRADLLLDRVILQQIHKKTAKGARVAISGKNPRAVPKRGRRRTRSNAPSINPNPTTRTIPKLLKEAKLRFTKERDSSGKWVHKVYLPPWDHTTPIIKSLAYAASLPANRAYTINLKLSDKVVEAALRSRFGFAVYMQKAIAKALRKHLPEDMSLPEFVIAVEGAMPISKSFEKLDMIDPFHIHGAIYLPIDDPKAFRFGSNAYDVEQSLLEAGGAFAPMERARQLFMTRMYDVAGWFSYASKARLTTEAALKSARRRLGLPGIKEESLVAATISIRRSGKEWYELARASEIPVLFQRRKPRQRSRPGSAKRKTGSKAGK